MADDEKKKKQILSITQEGVAPFCDTEKIKITIDGKEVLDNLRSMQIKFDLEKATTAYLEIIDFKLDRYSKLDDSKLDRRPIRDRQD